MFSIKELQKIFIPPLCDLLSIRIRTDKTNLFIPSFLNHREHEVSLTQRLSDIKEL